ncbi:MAG TPA: hypothetical protein VJY39_21100 [Acidisphaera sp.]|nr:hypothetical protein [Acidisphaera sp.]
MDKDTASEILDIAYSFDNAIVELEMIVEVIDDAATRVRYTEAIERLAALVADTLIFPLVDQFPELDRDAGVDPDADDDDDNDLDLAFDLD